MGACHARHLGLSDVLLAFCLLLLGKRGPTLLVNNISLLNYLDTNNIKHLKL